MQYPNKSTAGKTRLNRRAFLASSAAAGAFMVLPRHVLGGIALFMAGQSILRFVHPFPIQFNACLSG